MSKEKMSKLDDKVVPCILMGTCNWRVWLLDMESQN